MASSFSGSSPAAVHSAAARLPGLQGRADVSLHWLTRLRWGAVAAELLVVAAAVGVFALALPLGRVLGLIAFTAVSNLMLEQRVATAPGASRGLCGTVLALDTLVLTVLLHATGGASNPFSVLYLVHINLAAVMLGAGWTWALTALSVACYGSLFLPDLMAAGAAAGHHGEFASHLRAMWFAFTMAAVLSAYFVVRLSAAIERRDAELAAMREQATRNERLAALTTLAAGAAHELGTPLGTIAVVAKELERELSRLPVAEAASLGDDARLVRAEVERCRLILEQMASDAGETSGESPAAVALGDLAGEALRELPDGAATRIRVLPVADDLCAVLPRRAVVRAVTSLVRNALDATNPGEAVVLSVRACPPMLEIEVRDEGPGMPPEVLARAVEPFFTTKPAGCGLGLGLFLAKTLAERMGGALVLESARGAGVRAVLALPLARPA